MAADLIDFNIHLPAVLINEDGNFNKNVEMELNLADNKGLVGVISIMGVQSSGKSTLLNKCFSTNFTEMNAKKGMSQTTKGIWVAKLPEVVSGRTILVIDGEGTDGAERDQQGDDTFERKLMVFALASSDVVVLNMKCDSVNLNHGASIPLIKSVFQVMLKKFTTPRRVNLVFVLRDKNLVPLDTLKEQLMGQIHQIWDKIFEGGATQYQALDKYFTVDVVALSHYRHEKEAFNVEVVNLGKYLLSLLEHRPELNSAASFTNLAQRNWNDIRTDMILNLKVNKGTIEDAFCDKYKRQLVKQFRENKTWLQIREDVKTGKSRNFGKNVSSIIGLHLSEFDEETQQFNGSSRDNYRCLLNERLLEIVEETYLSVVEISKNAVLEKFDQEIAVKIKAGNHNNFDPDEFIKEFFVSLLDAHIKQADWSQTSLPYEEMKSLMTQHVQWAIFISHERKMLKRAKKALWMAAGGFVAGAVTCAGLLTTAIVVPGIGIGVAAAAASAGALTLPTTAVFNIVNNCGNYKKKKKELKKLGQDNKIAGSIYGQLSKKHVRPDNSLAIVCNPSVLLFSEDGRMDRGTFIETWNSLPDSNEVTMEFPDTVIDSADQTLARLSASNVFFVAKRKIENMVYLSAKTSQGFVFLIEINTVMGVPGVICAIKTSNPEMAPMFFDSLQILLNT